VGSSGQIIAGVPSRRKNSPGGTWPGAGRASVSLYLRSAPGIQICQAAASGPAFLLTILIPLIILVRAMARAIRIAPFPEFYFPGSDVTQLVTCGFRQCHRLVNTSPVPPNCPQAPLAGDIEYHRENQRRCGAVPHAARRLHEESRPRAPRRLPGEPGPASRRSRQATSARRG
jgi:hypothetical protein